MKAIPGKKNSIYNDWSYFSLMDGRPITSSTITSTDLAPSQYHFEVLDNTPASYKFSIELKTGFEDEA